jgi:peptidoglycan-associated lipoprotein
MTREGSARKLKLFVSLAVLAAVFSTGCAKKVAKAQPPAAPPPAAPTATLAANPSVIQQGQGTTLTWQTSSANEITIAGLGTLPASGSRSVTPGESMTYTLVAKGPGGTADASARVTVNVPVASANPAAGPTDQDLFARNMKDLFFDYDKSNIRSNQVNTAEGDAAFLGQHPTIKVLIEGHCDDRGSEEYNLALGTSRAESVKQSLQQQGISSDRIQTISYGKEKPFCTQDDEQCWQQNRVDHFVFQK